MNDSTDTDTDTDTDKERVGSYSLRAFASSCCLRIETDRKRYEITLSKRDTKFSDKGSEGRLQVSLSIQPSIAYSKLEREAGLSTIMP